MAYTGGDTSGGSSALKNFLTSIRRFYRHDGGQIAVIFALSSMMLVAASGAGLDLSRAYMARQKLSEVATLACQYASRPSIIQTAMASYSGANGGATYVSQVTKFINSSLSSQNFTITQTNSSPFIYTQNGAADVQLSATVPTSFMQIANVTQIPITVSSHCYDTPAAVVQRVPDGNSKYVVKETFEVGGGTGAWWYRFILPNGTSSTGGSAITASSFNNTVAYTGSDSAQWYVTGYCVEQDAAGTIKSNVADGNYSVELDCDNGSGSKGNSAITTKVYLPAGAYELRYSYSSRVAYPNYDPVYVCGSTASDVSWANDSSPQGFSSVSRTNQINVYLDLNTNGSPPVHTTIDGTQQLSGSNLIDTCVYGYNWLQRSIPITITTPGYYWLSFAADGTSDSYGAQLDKVQFCPISCPDAVQDNFPSAWTAGKTLFAENFESPIYVVDPTYSYNVNGNLFTSTGTSGPLSGWPGQLPSGWANAPLNNVPYWSNVKYSNGCPSTGKQCISLGYNQNNYISRPFLLVPGYYQVTYKYMSELYFSSVSGAYCGTTPTAANLTSLTGTANAVAFNNYNWGSAGKDTNTVAVFMSSAQLASTPNLTSTYNASATYNNPDGTTTSTAKVPPNNINLSNYNASQVNPLLDICGYSSTWQTRSRYIFIQKPAYYWLTFAALGTVDGGGGMIDDISLTVVGSPYMASPPSSYVTIPVPDPQPNATVSFTGFSIKANRLTP